MESTTLHDHDPEERPRHAVRLPVDPAAAVEARRAARRASQAAGLGRDRIDDLVVAVSEAVTNALEAHLEAGVTDHVEVTFGRHDEMFEVRVRDRGSGFTPDDVPTRPPQTDPRHLDVERGWGIQLNRQLVDELTFDTTGPGTTVCLRVRVR
jgi:serine/threonine-protein kinase RsbW